LPLAGMAGRIRVGVVGVGYFGRFHVRHYAQHPDAELIAVVDIDKDAASKVAAEYGCQALTEHRQLIGLVDAVSIATPTPHHAGIAGELLAAGVDILVEKPMTHDVQSAAALVKAAAQHRRILQVGHIERFSSCYRALQGLVSKPLYVESNRIAPWRERGTDVDVILDLMIHDIDIIRGLVGSPVATVDAVGTSVFSGKPDLANARITFESGCVANITASRVSHKTQRTMRIFQPHSYLVCDFGSSRIFSYFVGDTAGPMDPAAVTASTLDVPKGDSLANEIDEFLQCIRGGRHAVVNGRDGQEAIEIASRINQSIHQHHQAISKAGALR
jgi:predicted dehydrogenase